MSPSTTTVRMIAAGATAVLAASLLSGCSVLDGVISSVTGGGDDVFSIAVGDCWDDLDTSADEVSTVTSLSCDEEHDNEAYSSIILDDTEFPGDEFLLETADQRCYEDFPGFVGIAYEDSVIYYSYFYPSTESWDAGDHEILCFVYQDGEKTTGSLEGSEL